MTDASMQGDTLSFLSRDDENDAGPSGERGLVQVQQAERHVLPDVDAPASVRRKPTQGKQTERTDHRAKISAEEALTIFRARQADARRDRTSYQLAERYRISAKAVRDIWNLRTWSTTTKPLWTPEDHEKYLATRLCDTADEQECKYRIAHEPGEGGVQDDSLNLLRDVIAGHLHPGELAQHKSPTPHVSHLFSSAFDAWGGDQECEGSHQGGAQGHETGEAEDDCDPANFDEFDRDLDFLKSQPLGPRQNPLPVEELDFPSMPPPSPDSNIREAAGGGFNGND